MLNEKSIVKREQSRVAMARLVKRREEAGLRRVTFWAAPDVQDLLLRLQGSNQTRDDILNAIVRRYWDGLSHTVCDTEGARNSNF